MPFSHICNNSLFGGSFPENMKISKVITIFRSGDTENINNYRPISLLPTLSKVLERLVFNRLYKYLSVNHLIVKEQFGFRPKHSTELALIHVHATELLNSFLEGVILYADDTNLFFSDKKIEFTHANC